MRTLFRFKNALFSIGLALSFALLTAQPSHADKAYFAGGCFWCMEKPFEEMQGVSEVISGFTGGRLQNPSYSGNHSGHYEAVEVDYDPAVVSFEQLLTVYWKNIDPFDDAGQFCDKGEEYRPAIFFANESEKLAAEQSKRKLQGLFSSVDPALTIVTPILPVTQFWPVEEYHQDYYKKNPIRYRFYRSGCDRDSRLKAISRIINKANAGS